MLKTSSSAAPLDASLTRKSMHPLAHQMLADGLGCYHTHVAKPHGLISTTSCIAWKQTQLVQDDVDRGFFVSGARVTASDPDSIEIYKTAQVSTDFARSPSINLGECSRGRNRSEYLADLFGHA